MKESRSLDFQPLFFTIYLVGLFGVYASLKIFAFSLSYIIFPPLYLYSLFLFFRVAKSRYIKDFKRLVIILMSGLIISSLYSYLPLKSLLSVIFLSFNIIFSFLLFKYYNPSSLFRLILLILKGCLIISCTLLIIAPDIVIYVDPLERDSLLGLPNFKGLFPHKIHASIYNIIGFLITYKSFRKSRSKWDCLWAIAFVLAVLGSGSSLGALCLVLSLLIAIILEKSKAVLGYYGSIGLLFVLAAMACLIVFSGAQDTILESLGRDKNLTGRAFIWEFGAEYISQNWVFGSGFEVFFEENIHSPAQELWALMPYYSAPSFHNGYIEIIAEAGFVGALPFFWLIIFVFFKSLKYNAFFYVSLITICLVSNFGAALFVKPNMFFIVFLCWSYFRLSRKEQLSTGLNKKMHSSRYKEILSVKIPND